MSLGLLRAEDESQYDRQEFVTKYGFSPPGGRIWNGDVWKAMVQVRSWCDVESCTLAIDWGFGMITRNRNSDVLIDIPKVSDWNAYCDHEHRLLRIVSKDQAFELLGI